MSSLTDLLAAPIDFGALSCVPANDARGPFCGNCGHEYRKRGSNEPEPAGLFPIALCPYCKVEGKPLPEKPFVEISKSQIETWELCERRWFFKYIAKRPEPKNKYAEWGIGAHAVAEDWLARKKLPLIDSLKPKSLESKMATSVLAGIPQMPSPEHPGLQVESEFHFEFEGVRYGGFKDYRADRAQGCFGFGAFEPVNGIALEMPRAGDAATDLVQLGGVWMLPSAAASLWIPLVGDHKFTGDFKWALTSEALACDKQAVIYSWDEMRASDAIQHVWLNWVYMLRGERSALPVRALVNRPDILRELRKINPTGKELTQLRKKTDMRPREFRPDTEACWAFGQVCPHLDECNACEDVSVEERIGGQMSQSGNGPTGLDAIMASMGQGGVNGAPAAHFAPPPPVGAVGVLPPPAQFAPPPPPRAPAPPAAPPPPPAPPAGKPPSKRPPVIVTAPEPPAAPPVGTVQNGWMWDGQTWVTPPPGVPAGPPTIVASATSKGGRPKGARNKPKTITIRPENGNIVIETEQGQALVPAGELAKGKPISVKPLPTTDALSPAGAGQPVKITELMQNEFTLCVNCLPEKTDEDTELVSASDLVAEVTPKLCAELKVAHYRALDYGKGAGALAAYLETHLKSRPLGSDVIVILDSRAQEGSDIAPTLIRLARIVYRGT